MATIYIAGAKHCIKFMSGVNCSNANIAVVIISLRCCTTCGGRLAIIAGNASSVAAIDGLPECVLHGTRETRHQRMRA